MTQPDTGTPGGRTFTQAEVDQIVKDRIARERAKFADYDDLKAKAAEADKAATQLDKIQQQMTAMSERAEKSERKTMLREVADELKISVKQASRLNGKTKDELLADGREFLADFAPKSSGDNTGTGGEGGSVETPESAPVTTTRTRPKESLRSGAPMTETKPEETNPLKLAEMIPRH